MIEVSPIKTEVGFVLFGDDVHKGAAATNSFDGVHYCGINGASHNMKGEGDHAFEMEEESIHCVDWSLFQDAEAFRNLVPSVNGSGMLNAEYFHFIINFGWGQVFGGEGKSKFFDAMNDSA